MRFTISGMPIEVIKKNIKNLHLSVMPPNGHIIASVPLSISDENIRLFICSKIRWIKVQQEKYKNQLRHTPRQFVSGETLFVWGKQYFLQVNYKHKGNNLALFGDKATLTVREESTIVQRENFVNKWLRTELKKEIFKRLPLWEQKTGLKCLVWQIRYMKTRWGTYSEKTGRILFNLQLAKKPFKCLDYIIVHELGHKKYRRHDKNFIAYMDTYFPHWRETKKLLNEKTLDYLE